MSSLSYGRRYCRMCRHSVNQRSQRCDLDHPLCTEDGCSVSADARQIEAKHLPVVDTYAAIYNAAPPASQTKFLIDIASYQAGVDLNAVKAAGFSAVNIKLSQGNWYTFKDAGRYADEARSLGMDVIGFHWLDNSSSGSVQAAIALNHARAIGALSIQCDCEDVSRPATWQIWHDFMTQAQAGMGRPIPLYTGDWFWQPRGWNGASVTPYLWAAPNAGYLPWYPGDGAAAWLAGYGGWPTYGLLQYTVAPVLNAGGGQLSLTAIRDPAVWAAITGTKQHSGDKVLILVQADSSSRVLLCDGISCRYVSDQDIADLRYLAQNAAGFTLANGGKVWPGWTPAFGKIQDEGPVAATLTDGQVATLGETIASAIKSLSAIIKVSDGS